MILYYALLECINRLKQDNNNMDQRESSSKALARETTKLTNSSSMLVWHFSRLILFMATRSCLGVQRAACTTAVAPLPGITEQRKIAQEQSHHKHLEENS